MKSIQTTCLPRRIILTKLRELNILELLLNIHRMQRCPMSHLFTWACECYSTKSGSMVDCYANVTQLQLTLKDRISSTAFQKTVSLISQFNVTLAV